MRDTMAPGGISTKHAEWLEARKIPIEIANREGLFSRGPALGWTHTMHGEVLYEKFRSLIEKRFWRSPSGTPAVPWGFDSLPRIKSETTTGPDNESDADDKTPLAPLIWVEGEMDRLAQLAAGAQYVISVPDGARAAHASEPGDVETDRNYDWLYNSDGEIHPEINQFRHHILAVDGDEPGQILAADLAVRLGRARCWLVAYGKGCKDSNDILMQQGTEAVAKLAADAKPIVPSRLASFSDIPRAPETRQYSSGFAELDNHFRLKRPSLVIVTGNPGAGKSQWCTALVANMARLHGMKSAIIGFEDDVDRVRDDLLRYATAWQHASQPRYAVREAPEAWVGRYFRVLPPNEDDEDFTLDWLKRTIEEAVYRHGCELIYLDPWNELEHLWDRHEGEHVYIRKALVQIKRWARKLQVIVVLVAHPTKAAGASKTLDDWNLYAIEGGNSWNTKADHGVVIFREDESTDRTIVKICKSKIWRTMGIPGAVEYSFNGQSTTYKFVAKVKSEKAS